MCSMLVTLIKQIPCHISLTTQQKGVPPEMEGTPVILNLGQSGLNQMPRSFFTTAILAAASRLQRS